MENHQETETPANTILATKIEVMPKAIKKG